MKVNKKEMLSLPPKYFYTFISNKSITIPSIEIFGEGKYIVEGTNIVVFLEDSTFEVKSGKKSSCIDSLPFEKYYTIHYYGRLVEPKKIK